MNKKNIILSFDKPKKVKTTKQHNELYSSDCGCPGTFIPNMSEKDNLKWKAKHIQGDNERIEIRKSIGGTQLLIVVFKKKNNIKISMNGALYLSFLHYKELQNAIRESFEIFDKVRK